MQVDNDFQTPFWCCEYMASLLESNIHTILEPTPGKGNLVKILNKHFPQVLTPQGNFWDLINSEHYGSASWDAVVMNPPATPMQNAYNILYECMKYTDRIVALMPWLTIINSQKRTKDILDFGLISITHLPRSTFPGSRIQTCVLNMKKNYEKEIKFKVIGHGID
ncbi:MAG: hypothetical protein ACFE95_12315 [Candidatus Hodarchaeota archaeon]